MALLSEIRVFFREVSGGVRDLLQAVWGGSSSRVQYTSTQDAPNTEFRDQMREIHARLESNIQVGRGGGGSGGVASADESNQRRRRRRRRRRGQGFQNVTSWISGADDIFRDLDDLAEADEIFTVAPGSQAPWQSAYTVRRTVDPATDEPADEQSADESQRAEPALVDDVGSRNVRVED